jgi:spermidine/putrescine transport system ATP-binding protein
MATSIAIKLDDVTKQFGDFTAVDDVSLSIKKGEFFSLLGPSGCGKTTTLRMIAGFEQPTEGQILLEGDAVEDVPPNERNVNTVFQSYALFEHLNVEDNVAFGLKRKKVPKDEIERRVAEALELVSLEHRAEARTTELSGGMQQRVAVARALVNRPAVLLLDEPLGALDLKLRRQMQVELKDIQREVGITFVYVTHDQEEALAMSDRIAVMHEGRVVQCGEPEDIYEKPDEAFVAGFIGVSNLMEGVVDGKDKVKLASGQKVDAPLPEGLDLGEVVQISVRPEKIALDDIEKGMVSIPGTVEQRVYQGVNTQVTVSLGDGARVVALEQNTYRARSDDRWEPGTKVKVGWHPDHCLVLR